MRVKLFAIIIIISLLLGCGTDQSEKKRKLTVKHSSSKSLNKEFTHKLSTYIHSVVNGEIKPDDLIKVKFMSPQVTISETEVNLKEKIFSFEPAIKGTTYWLEKDLLVFKPSKQLAQRQNYKGQLNINEIIDNEDVEIENLTFAFSVMGREITQYSGDYIKEEGNLVYKGKIGFSLHINLQKLKKSFKIYIDNKSLDINWKDEGSFFSFTTEPIDQHQKSKEIKLKIESKILNLSEDYERDLSIESLYEMAVLRVSTLIENDNPEIEVEFSKDLADDFDVRDYLIIEPNLKTKIIQFKNKIRISGDFKFGEKYSLLLKKGLRNIQDEKSHDGYRKEIVFSDQKPQLIFSQDGAILPSGNDRKIYFNTLNLKKVHVSIEKVFDNNLIYFLQEASLDSYKKKTDFYYYSMARVGEHVKSQQFEIGEIKNKWLQHELDLSKIIPETDKGLYLVKISFVKDDILYRGIEYSNERNDWYANPYSRGYYYRHGSIYKPIILSDLGITAKKDKDEYIVYVTDINSTKPINNIKVTLKSYNNQDISTGKTDSNGKIRLLNSENKASFITAENRDQRSILKLNEMQWNLSTFDIKGVDSADQNTRAYIYTERGVYRPGDEINVSLIFRNQENTFPENHPVKIEIRNPINQLEFSNTLKIGRDGFYHFAYSTSPDDLTGTWKLKVSTGGMSFHHNLKIESVVAERLKILIEPEKELINYNNTKFKINLQANYLFGNPASGLDAILNAELISQRKSFSDPIWNNYNFEDQTIDFKQTEIELFKFNLDENGNAEIIWTLPENLHAPASIMTKIEAEISELGGRSSKKKIYLPYEPYKYYLGIEDSGNDWKKINEENKINFILLDQAGKPVSGKDVVIRIYRNKNYWWWQYDRRDDAKLHYKTDTETELLREFYITSANKPIAITFTPDSWGEYLIEAYSKNDQENIHKSSQFFYASHWGKMTGGMQNAGILTIQSDKQNYQIGEKAEISFPLPKESAALVTLEKGNKIIEEFWYKGKIDNNTATIEFPITREMLPNIYCSVSVLQPQAQSDNDRPVRMYGIIPINVADPESRQELILETPEILKPNQKFICKIQTKDKKQAQYTIAVVDEGLLSLTDFPSPNAWKEFYRKIRLAVKTFDNFSYFIGINRGDIFKHFSVGGGLAFKAWQKQQQAPDESKRFKPVSLFKGPLETDENGYGVVEFIMPDYVGAVRVMVVSASNARFGNVEKTIPVKQDLMILPTLPRKLSPEDDFVIPVDIFVTNDAIKEVHLKIITGDKIQLTSNDEYALYFTEPGQKSYQFSAKIGLITGNDTITIEASGGDITTSSVTDISIIPSSPRISEKVKNVCFPGSSIKLKVPDKGIPGSMTADLILSKREKLDITKRLKWLHSYPYGCLEQTVSSVFPQLYLREFIPQNFSDINWIDENINGAIKRLNKYQFPNGGLSYWPGNKKINSWGTCYAAHFLIEAQESGYFISKDMLSQLARYLRSVVKKDNDSARLIKSDTLRKTQLYRLYILARMDKPEISSMNYLHEEVLKYFDDTERWLLATTYELAGMTTISKDIIRGTGILVPDYSELGGSFGSSLRDKGIILNCAIATHSNEIADKLYNNISATLSSDQWFNTQSLSYALLALGKYIKNNPEEFNETPITGELLYPDGSRTEIEVNDKSQIINLDDNCGEEITIRLDKSTEIEKIYASIIWSGIPLKPPTERISENLTLKRKFTDKDNNLLDPSLLKQGDLFYEVIEVSTPEDYTLENMALVQVLPSGWEIENERINPDKAGNKSKRNTHVSTIEYIDIRDDRIMWFFNLSPREPMQFKVELRAVTAGKFTLPPTTVETMYSDRYIAREPGITVSIEPK